MGFRLYAGTAKNMFDAPSEYVCYWKFYGYAPFRYVERSFKFLEPIIVNQDKFLFENTFSEDLEDKYDIFTCVEHTITYKLTAEEFRKFISLYKEDRELWCKDKNEKWIATEYEDHILEEHLSKDLSVYIEWG